jgi:acyl-CoA synthetase (AMP-forming)/AMP-acid ligase II
MPFSFGDIVDAVARSVPPERAAFVHSERTIPWGESYRRMNNLARALASRGLRPLDKVAFYMRNGIEYGELTGACFLGRFVHVNINYRYKPDEVRYIVDNSDAAAIVYEREFRDNIAQIHNQLPKVRAFIEVNEGPDVASFAEQYEKLAINGSGDRLAIERSADDQVFVYTGGTTGMPKGVIYAHGDLAATLLARLALLTGRTPASPEDVAEMGLAAGAPCYLPACPQMHGTGFFGTMATIMGGGTVVTVDNVSLDAHAIWAAVERNRVTSMAIVGDPFARPMLNALEEAPGRYDLSSVVAIGSSGAMWTAEVKQGLLQHIPQAILTDNFASTEALGMGASITTKGGESRTAAFTRGENAIVIDDNDQPIPPGTGVPGRLAVGGVLPLGYYKDPEKTARTIKIIDGKRYSIPGDYALIEADGSLVILGRGSNCINTAGEKVFPEEVEEALKTHPSVEDALVIGVPDPQWGSAVTGIVTLVPGKNFDEGSLRAHVRDQLAGYKTPKRVLVAEVALRAPNGKADYKGVTEFARAALGILSV